MFFPEKRPFFLENAGLFQTPINVLFTRRIADPQVGARVTGKLGAWTVGALAADDEAPGKRVSAADPLTGARAWNGIARVSRSLFGRSTFGAMVTQRAVEGHHNAVAGMDARVRMGRVWTADGQYAISRLVPAAGAESHNGSAYLFALSRNGRTVTSRTELDGRSERFVTELGFVPRVDVHEGSQSLSYTFRPAGTLSDWGPTLLLERAWAHGGMPLDWRARPSISFNFERSTSLGGFVEASHVTLRPGDAPNVTGNLALRPDTVGVAVHAGVVGALHRAVRQDPRGSHAVDGDAAAESERGRAADAIDQSMDGALRRLQRQRTEPRARRNRARWPSAPPHAGTRARRLAGVREGSHLVRW